MKKYLIIIFTGVCFYNATAVAQTGQARNPQTDTVPRETPKSDTLPRRELPDQRLSLKQCVETGIANNLDVRRGELALQTAKINWNQARLNQLPYVGGSASSGINQGRSIDPFTNTYSNQQINFSSYGVSGEVTVFNGGNLKNQVRQNELGYDAAKADWQQLKDNLTINIILAYLQVLSNADQLTQSTQQLELTRRQVERLEALNAEGATSPYLLYDLRGQYANDKLSIIAAINALATSKVQLCALMNVPYRAELEVERLDQEEFVDSYEGTPDEIYQETLREFALVKAVNLRTQSSSSGVKAARSQLWPVLSLGGNVQTNYSSAARKDVFINNSEVITDDYVLVGATPSPVIRQQSNFSSDKISYNNQLNNNLFNQVSLNLRVPIFGNWVARNRIRLAQVQLKTNQLVEASTKTQLQQSVEQAHVNLVSAQDRYKTLLEQVEAYKESFRSAEIRFNEGVVNSVDYLVAKNNLDRSNINLIAAKYDYVLRTKVLDYYRGRKLW